MRADLPALAAVAAALAWAALALDPPACRAPAAAVPAGTVPTPVLVPGQAPVGVRYVILERTP